MRILISQLLLSALIFFVFRFKNANKDYLTAISVALSMIPLVYALNHTISFPASLQWFNPILVGFKLIISFSLGLTAICLYLIRFWKKDDKWNPIEIIKVFAVVQFCIIYAILKSEQSDISLAVLIYVFLSTRAAQLNSIKMVRNSMVALLILVTVFCLVYARLNANEVDYVNETSSQKLDKLESKVHALQIELNACEAGK
jgi:hypothetical protein